MNLYLRLLLVRLRARRRRHLSLWETARTPFRVVPSDLDLLGHMNNGKFLSLLDVGRIDLLLRSGFWERLRRIGWYPVVAGQTITYRRSLKLRQRFDLYSRVLGFDDRWIYIEQTFVADATVHAHAVVRARFLKRGGGSVSREEIEELTGGIPEHLVVPAWVDEWTQRTRSGRAVTELDGADP